MMRASTSSTGATPQAHAPGASGSAPSSTSRIATKTAAKALTGPDGREITRIKVDGPLPRPDEGLAASRWASGWTRAAETNPGKGRVLVEGKKVEGNKAEDNKIEGDKVKGLAASRWAN